MALCDAEVLVTKVESISLLMDSFINRRTDHKTSSWSCPRRRLLGWQDLDTGW